MKHKSKDPLARQEKLVIQEMPDEVLVYDLKQNKAHCLNKAAAFVWNQCDGQTSVAELAHLMVEEFKTPFDETLVWRAIDQLNKADLLEVKVERPKEVVLQSRRRMLGRLGSAALLSVPVVMSITLPVAAAAASVPTACIACVKKVDNCPSACISSNTIGQCYGNSGCGTGQALGCMTCSACFSPGGGDSWVAPGTPTC